MKDEAKKIIRRLNLTKHIEGGYFRRTYQSSLPINFNNQLRPITTAIYYLLESHDFSCWHRLRSDEIWHYYAGSDLIIHQINEEGVLSSICLGNLLINSNATPQCLIPAGNWFAAEVSTVKSFTLVGCTVAPGFEYTDFELGNHTELLKRYPQHEQIILKLSRDPHG